ncbi:ribosomal protection-like ABC-F family protein [Wansuia hejianensis]|uniref:ABC-F type ribosomal protection protein n=1 Tax=Wansuia hejianensis TaxID=2763667 RepID=A0A926EYG9_9FIRM|nr:ABC-F type ribosomal protection protein [Wansuia hejianensis]MBC8591281.1 ABC-F type ribosomal protection protein [Wansuia hejianensis]
MALIDIRNLTFEYSGSLEPVFENLNLQLDTNWKLGFIGRNGYGKTTFLKLLVSEYSYKGSIVKPIPMVYFPFSIENYEIMTLELLEKLQPNFQLWKLKREMNLLEVDDDILYRIFSTLSGGEQTKILLALLFAEEERFLLIDEPTNHLDSHGREVVARYLERKKGFILVSHDREFINSIVEHILTIEKSKIVLQKGTYDTWEENKNLEDQYELDKNQKLRKEIRRLKQSAREKAIWSHKVEATKNTKISGIKPDKGYIGHMAAKMMKRSKTIEKRYDKAIEEKQKLLKNIEPIDKLEMNILDHHAKQYINAENFTICYGDNNVFEPIEFTIERGDCIVFRGNNGSGKSSIIKAVLGKEVPWKGKLEIAKGITISYVPQKFHYINGNINEFINEEQLDRTKFLTILRKLGFSRNQFEIPIEDFSMGQKKKIFLAKSICEEANLFIWDEPLNYIDVISRIQIENMILEYSPTMILVEHDRRFIDKVATDIIDL